MSTKSGEGLSQAYGLIRSGSLDKAKELLELALIDELENKEILFAISCCSFWIDTVRRFETTEDLFEKSECLVNEWKVFSESLDKDSSMYDRTLYEVRHGIFSLALSAYSLIREERDFSHKAEIMRKIGLCYKKLGEYETAKNCLSEANSLHSGEAQILAELADCYALCGEERHAKVLFREAFFVNAKKIEPAFLDSELINSVIRNVREKGYTGQALMEWIPVYGHLFGVFTVKRRLRPQEVGRLKQEIYAMENEMKNPSCAVDILTPRLINLYFWIIDYYTLSNEEIRKINDILIRIKVLDPAIYTLFVR